MSDNIRMTIHMDQESKTLLEEHANNHGTSISAIIRIMARIFKVPAPPERLLSDIREDIRAIILEELGNGHH
jgi:hypothetical protein